MRLSVSLPLYNTSPTRMGAMARAAEEAGFHSVWDYEMFHDPYLAMSVAAGATQRIGIGTGIALAPSRSPLVTAVAAADLHELSGGRFRLGIGAGDPRQLREYHGVEIDRPLTRMREYVTEVRARWRFLADQTQLPGYHRSTTCEQIPLYVAAMRPRMLRMAGEIADGVIGYFYTPAYLRTVVRPSVGDAEIVTYVIASVGSDRDEAMRRARVHVGTYLAVMASTAGLLPDHDLPAAQREVRKALRDHGPAGLADVLDDDVVRALSVVGTPDECRSQLAVFDGLTDEIVLHTPATPPLTAAESAESFAAILAVASGPFGAN